jgi:hypothetical protein
MKPKTADQLDLQALLASVSGWSASALALSIKFEPAGVGHRGATGAALPVGGAVAHLGHTTRCASPRMVRVHRELGF